ncbi:MAG: hypothetical protein CVU13_03810 [Bacteroidetes bacterium HGW-Bacteroidetes-8]|jgi:AraC-like DNA-binding protein|nr:MAG: hypothetical protein CVU13_03810 [Bacteroidetes bacterium HGW-Bacteroidetes-8]
MIEFIVFTLPMFVSLFWAVALFADAKRDDKPRVLLAVFMLFATILYASHALYFSGNYNIYVIMDPLYTLASLSVFPLFYLYIKTIAKESKPDPIDLWILLPGLFFGITSAIFFIILTPDELFAYIRSMVYKEKTDFIFSTAAKIQVILYKAGRVVFAIQLVPSVYFSWKLIRAYDKKIKEFYSSTEERTLTWAGNMMIAMVSAAIFSLILNTLGKAFFIHDSMLLLFPSLAFSIILYAIGFMGFKQRYSIQTYQGDILKDNNINHKHSTEVTRQKLHDQLLVLLNEKEIFRNTNLRITDISQQLGTNRSYVSNIVNNEFKSTFSDLINHYRVEYAKKLLLDEKLFILEYISEESGFASVNSFLRAFKKETGTTPGNYRKEINRKKIKNQ